MQNQGRTKIPSIPPEMEADEYLKKRVDNQIDWYNRASMSAKRKYFTARTLEIVVAAFIPFVLHFWEWEYTRKVAAFCGVLIVGVNGLLGLYKWGDLWKNYRTTSETLKHHKHLFLAKSSPYDGEDPFNAFVNNAERIISEENSVWNQIPFEKPRASE